MTTTMPVLFVGHGNPMNALQQNTYTEGWASLGVNLPRPKAILAISAHWYVPETAVTAMPAPRTIHDFGGFPPELYLVSYPSPGDVALASRIQSLLTPVSVRRDEQWGLDHGTWSVLCHIYPHADIPVVQLSIDETQPAAFHYELGKRLAPLRDEGVLILGSGNLVHNLHSYAWGSQTYAPFDWGLGFENRARELLTTGEDGLLIDYEAMTPDALLAVPTPDHYLPLLYIVALRRTSDSISFPIEGFDGGSISMLSVALGNV